MKDEIEKSSSRSTGRGGDLLPKIGKEQEEKPVGDFDDMMSHPVMFGDPFGNRGDYSKGLRAYSVVFLSNIACPQ